jgi:glucose/arabinose dehydrogenase
MRLALLPCCLGLLLGTTHARAEEPWKPKPYGIDKRTPWTTSKVIGSPTPPSPYRVVNAYPKLKIVCPIAVAHEPGTGNLLVIHQMFAWGGTGRILRVKDDPASDKVDPLLTMDRIAYGLAFHPDYAKNGYLFVGSNGPTKDKPKFTRVSRFTVGRTPPHAIDPKSEKIILEWASDGHNGGDLAFGLDGMLYVTSGDGTSDSDTNHAGQDLTKLLSKVLRLDVDKPEPGKAYTVPKDNPFVGEKDIRPETWAYGFRNPWRITVDRKTGDVWVGQNGQDLWEQAYLVKKGANYGWSVVEGGHPFYPNRKAGPHPIQKPTVDHPHSEFRSLTGGIVYYGKKHPDLTGAYIYGDWSSGRIWGVKVKEGKIEWNRELADTTLQVTGFGTDSHGELLVADHGGAIYGFEATPKEANPAKFPTRLSETGLFTSVKDHKPDPGLIPYSVNAPLWSDGAEKERFLGLPGDTRIDFTTSRGWNFGDGTVLVKTFSLPDAARAGAKRRIETRLLTKQQGKWAGYSYVWNAEQTDAELVSAAGLDRVYEVADGKDGRRKQTWHFPSRVECMVCHSRAANFVLGLSELQMNKDHDYRGVVDNQLRTLEHLGVFKVPPGEHVRETKQRVRTVRERAEQFVMFPVERLQRASPPVPPLARTMITAAQVPFAKPWDAMKRDASRRLAWLEEQVQRGGPTTKLPKWPGEYRRLVDPYDRKQPLELRARSYLHANCAQCHVEAGGGNAQMELEFITAPEKMRVLDVKPLHHHFDGAEPRLIAPGAPERSMIYRRLALRGTGQMPPLATAEVDREALKLMEEWIRTMKPAEKKRDSP